MAIVLNNTPVNNASLQGDLLFTAFESVKAIDPVTYPNYKYICDVYVAGVMIFRARAFPRPDNKRGVFNIAPILRSYVAMNFAPTGPGMLVQEFGAGVWYLDVVCKFGEEYNFTSTSNLTIDSSRRYYNHYNNQIYSVQTILTNYINNLASNRPYYNSLRLSVPNFFVPFYSTGSSITVSVTTYSSPLFSGGYILDTDGSIISTDTGERILLPGSGYVVTTATGTGTLSVTGGSLQQLNLAPSAINSTVGSALIDATTDYYVVTLNGTVSLCFRVVCEAIYKPYTLHFMNQLGGFDSVEFRKLSRKTYDIEKKTYVQQPFRMDSGGLITYSNPSGVVNESVTTYSSQFTPKLKLSTDMLTDVDFAWLKELVFSPLVYLQDAANLVPVSITATSYEEMKYVNERNISALQVDLEYGTKLNAQYR